MSQSDIPQELVDEVMARCARHCCVCRRHAPLHLQVHHIVERANGGPDTLANLIAICLTCHCDVHTKTFFTRRFTPGELVRGRDEVYRLVSEGRLPHADLRELQYPAVLSLADRAVDGGYAQLPRRAVEFLLAAALSERSAGEFLAVTDRGGWRAYIGPDQLLELARPRDIAECKHALDVLCDEEMFERMNGSQHIFNVTYRGYQTADELAAAGMSVSLRSQTTT